MIAVACHAYAGGFSWGMRKSGVDVVAHLEPAAYKGFGTVTARANLGVETIVGEDKWRAARFRGGCGCVFGNPPCAAYSNASAGQWGPWREERRAHGLQMLGLLDDISPDFWVMESVPGILNAGAGVVAAIQQGALQRGYSFTIWAHDHRFLGAAQRRPRVYMIAHRYDLEFPLLGDVAGRPLTAVKDVIGDIRFTPGPYRNFKPRFRAIWEMTPQGAGPREVDMRVNNKTTSTFSLLDSRLQWDVPGPTLLGSCEKYAHPLDNRHISVFEMQRLCGYPDDWLVANINHAPAEFTKASLPTGGVALGAILMEAAERRAPPRWRMAFVEQRADRVHELGHATNRCRNEAHIHQPIPGGVGIGPVALSRAARLNAEQLCLL